MVTWVFYFCLGLGIGGAAGFYFARLDDLNKKKRQELEEKLAAAENQYLDYKKEVTGHFMDTATLINNMTDSYQAVHEHLTKGAQTLCNNELEVNRIEVVPLKTPLIETPTDATASVEARASEQKQTPVNEPQQQNQTRKSDAPTGSVETNAVEINTSSTPDSSELEDEQPDSKQSKSEETSKSQENKAKSAQPSGDTQDKIKLEQNERRAVPQTAAVVTPPIVESMAVVDEADTLEAAPPQEEPTAVIPDRIIH